MALRPNKPCSSPNCPRLTRARFCEQHAAQHLEQLRAQDRARAPIRARYESPEWRAHRRVFLQANPYCVRCGAPADTVDHIRSWRTGKTPDEQDALFWDESNHQPLCHNHHSQKTAARDGGFGNRRIGVGFKL